MSNELQERDPLDRCLSVAAVGVDLVRDPDWYRPPWISGTDLTSIPHSQAPSIFQLSPRPAKDHANEPQRSSITVAEFIEGKFIPEYVAVKRTAGRSYFRTILNHVLPPETVARAFGVNSKQAKSKLEAVPGWPYLDFLPLSDIKTEMIQRLTITALNHGYSTQTAAHIRNVIRVIFSHAIRTGCYTGTNPANLVTIPEMARKEAHALGLTQLRDVMQEMHYPEKEIAAFTILTEMSVAEICGLQWKYVNGSNISRVVEDEVILPKTIAVRMQSYRGEFGVVPGNRSRLIRVPEALGSILRDLKNRNQFTTPDDFVLVSRNGTPIHPENVAARRLKSIGKSLGMSWLSWRVFYRTRVALKSEFGRRFHEELEKVIPLRKSGSHR